MASEAARYVITTQSLSNDDMASTNSDFARFYNLSIHPLQVRGESYEQTRSLKKKKPSKPATKKQPKKTVLYEAEEDEITGGKNSNRALHAGLGKQVDGMEKVRKMKNMALEKRFRLEEEEEKPIQKLTVNKGGSKEVAYIPKDSKKKKEEPEKEGRGERGGKRQRRGVKDLKFQTPFKDR
jgi:hypothetical protein